MEGLSLYRNRRNRNASGVSSNSRPRVNGSRKTLVTAPEDQNPEDQQLPFTSNEMTPDLKKAKEAGPVAYAFVLTMRYSGLRIFDVCMLRTDSLQGNHLVLRTEKTETPVKVLLPALVANTLRAIQEAHQAYFFWNGRSKMSSVTDLWRTHRIKPIHDDAEVKNAHPHRFRHTFAVGPY